MEDYCNSDILIIGQKDLKGVKECVNGIAISSEASDMKPRRPARGFELAKRRRNAMLQQGL